MWYDSGDFGFDGKSWMCGECGHEKDGRHCSNEDCEECPDYVEQVECDGCSEDYPAEEDCCPSCGLGRPVLRMTRRTYHVARKAHGNIKPGDKYCRYVQAGYRIGGGRWMEVSKHRC